MIPRPDQSLDPANRSVAFQLWTIGALIPLAFIATRQFGAYDFSAFWFAARQVLSGHTAEVYNSAATLAFAERWSLGGPAIFPYPPHALFIFLPFALVPYIPAYVTWNIVTGALFLWAARPYLPTGFPSILVILTPAALISFNFGQTGLLFGALWLLAFRGKWAAVALLTFKPHLGVLSILSLRGWRAFVAAALLTVGILSISVIIFGPGLWQTFFTGSIEHADKIATMTRWLFAGVTPAIGYGLWGWIAFAIVGAMLLAERVNAFTAATASFLISPYGFHYDMPVACLGFGLLIFSHWRDMPIRHRIPIAIGFLSPVIAHAGAWWMPPLIGWALWAQTKYTIETDGTGRES